MLENEKSGTTDSQEYQIAMEVFYNKHLLQPKFLDAEQKSLIARSASQFNLDAYLAMWGPSGFFANGSLANYDRYEDLRKINIPTFFACGEFDEATPGTVCKFHKQVRHSLFRIMKACSHQAYFEMPFEFQKMLSIAIDELLANVN